VKPRFFKSPAEFRAWLERNHAGARELLVGFHKRGTGRPSLTWPESVDEALCFGWIDGIRRRIDDERYSIRFTPRRPGSIWSLVNTRRVAALEREGRMHEAGLKAFRQRDPKRTGIYSFEREKPATFPPELERIFRANKDAWAYFESSAPWYRRVTTHWVTSAKQDATRERRLAHLIACSARGKKIDLMKPGKSR
jgi:uncharacterized protein YdeI (YjbR/CyaY-like superfamily)